MDIRTWLRSELNDDELEGTLARYTRPRRGGGSPSMSPKFTAVGSDKTVAAIGANTPQLDEQYTTAEAIASAKDDGTSAPQVAKDYIAAYMADPEWQAWDKTETAAMSHSGWGPIWDANTGGGYSRNKQMNAANASYKKREIEKRYYDRAIMAASKQAAAFADNDKWIGDIVSGMQTQHEYGRQSELDKQKAAESAAHIRLLEEQAKAAAALAGQREDGRPIEVSPGASLYDPSAGKKLFTAPLTPSQANRGGDGDNGRMSLAQIEENARRFAETKLGSTIDKESPNFSDRFAQEANAERERLLVANGYKKPSAAAEPQGGVAEVDFDENGKLIVVGGAPKPAAQKPATPATKPPEKPGPSIMERLSGAGDTVAGAGKSAWRFATNPMGGIRRLLGN